MDNDTPTSVYQYFDAYDTLIYVGITARGAKRQTEHNKTKTWWPYVERQTVEHHATRDAALERESELIVKHRPPYNIQQNPTHAQERATYEAFRELLTAAPDVVALAQQCRRQIPLTLISRTADRAEFLIPVEFAPITMRLSITGQPKGITGTTKCGMVTDLTRRGGHALLSMKVRSTAPILEPFARLKMTTVRDGADFEIRNVQLAA